MKTKRVALYARVSTDAQTTENQLLQLRAVAERHGWAIVAEFVDHGASGAKGRHERPQFDALLRGVARREFDMIAAWSVDRLAKPRARHRATGPVLPVGLGIVLLNAIMFLKVVTGAKKLDICCGERGTALRVRQHVIEVQLVLSTALYAAAIISLPDF